MPVVLRGRESAACVLSALRQEGGAKAPQKGLWRIFMEIIPAACIILVLSVVGGEKIVNKNEISNFLSNCNAQVQLQAWKARPVTKAT